MIEKLQKFGLSEKEARVCAALFEIPGSVVTDVAKRASINRSTTYVLLESLGKRGLVSISERRGVRVYSPVSPDRLVEMAETELSKSKELLDLSRELASSIKKMLTSEPSRSKVKVYESAEGIKIISENKLNAKEGVRSYAAIKELRDVFPRFFQGFEKRQSAQGKAIKQLAPDTAETREFLRESGKVSATIGLIPDSGFTSGLDVFDNKVTFISPEENTALVIESKQFAHAVKALFDLASTKARAWNVRTEEKTKVNPKKEVVLVKAQNRFFGK